MPPIPPKQSTLDVRLALLDDLRRRERHAAVSRVASVIGHLIGTPLNVIAGRAALIRANPADAAAVGANAQRIEQQVEQLAQRIRKLIDFLTLDDAEIQFCTAASVVEDALALYGPVASHRGIEIVVTPEIPDATLEGTSSLIVLTSLLSLATAVAPSGASVGLSVKAGSGTVSFELNIPGFDAPRTRLDRLDPPDDQQDVAQAETLQVLSVCYAIARRHGGRLDVETSVPVVIRLTCPVH